MDEKWEKLKKRINDLITEIERQKFISAKALIRKKKLKHVLAIMEEIEKEKEDPK